MKRENTIVATILAVSAVFVAGGLEWGIVHGIAELGQFAGVYEWEPMWAQTLFGTMVINVLYGIFK